MTERYYAGVYWPARLRARGENIGNLLRGRAVYRPGSRAGSVSMAAPW